MQPQPNAGTEYKELRTLAPRKLELRKTSTGQRIGGTAIEYNSLSEDLGGFVERIAPGAFTASLRNQDVLCLFGHDENRILGRRSAGTLRITDTQAGLQFECDLPNTVDGETVATLCARGDLKAMSFGFIVANGGDEWTQQGTQVIRTVRQAELLELSAVAFPAYGSTTCSLRSCPQHIRARLNPASSSADNLDALTDEAREDALRWRLLTQHRMKHI